MPRNSRGFPLWLVGVWSILIPKCALEIGPLALSLWGSFPLLGSISSCLHSPQRSGDDGKATCAHLPSLSLCVSLLPSPPASVDSPHSHLHLLNSGGRPGSGWHSLPKVQPGAPGGQWGSCWTRFTGSLPLPIAVPCFLTSNLWMLFFFYICTGFFSVASGGTSKSSQSLLFLLGLAMSLIHS